MGKVSSFCELYLWTVNVTRAARHFPPLVGQDG